MVGRQTVAIPNERLSTKVAQLSMELKEAHKLLVEVKDKSAKEVDEEANEQRRPPDRKGEKEKDQPDPTTRE